jgi:hypothetical protein
MCIVESIGIARRQAAMVVDEPPVLPEIKAEKGTNFTII